MPTYEPTAPKLFTNSPPRSTVVSRSASRRNSFHYGGGSRRPSFSVASPEARPIDGDDAIPGIPSIPLQTVLADALGRLQKTSNDGRLQKTPVDENFSIDEDRGRDRSRRDDSVGATARARIAQWEERSRSRSNGRSLSKPRRGGVLTDDRKRVSVVPEMPDLERALIDNDLASPTAATKPGAFPRERSVTRGRRDKDDRITRQNEGLTTNRRVAPVQEIVIREEVADRPIQRPSNQTESQPTDSSSDWEVLSSEEVNPTRPAVLEVTSKHDAKHEETYHSSSNGTVSEPAARSEVQDQTPSAKTKETLRKPLHVHKPSKPVRVAGGREHSPDASNSNQHDGDRDGLESHDVPEPHADELSVAHTPSGDPDTGRGRRRTRDWETLPEVVTSPTNDAKMQSKLTEPSTLRDLVLESQEDNEKEGPDTTDVQYAPQPAPREESGALGSSDTSSGLAPPAPSHQSRLSPAAAPFEPRKQEENAAGPGLTLLPPPPATHTHGGRSTQTASRQPSRSRARGGRRNRSRSRQPWRAPPLIERLCHAASVGMMQGFSVFPIGVYHELRSIYYPPPAQPDFVKAYDIRQRLPIRIYFPKMHDPLSLAVLPTVFTIHGGAFTTGTPSDDDGWNRKFADTFNMLVVALNYAKAPWASFPLPLLDVEALYHAVMSDDSLPIDRQRIALLGFDAGANLALGLAQLPSVKEGRNPNPQQARPRFTTSNVEPPPYAAPRAVIPVCGLLDFAVAPESKARSRPYKRQLRGPRGWGPGLDWILKILPATSWSYIPYGHDLRDPLLSPVYAARSDLPPHVFVVAAELDVLAHESWRAATQWAGRALGPGVTGMVGRRGTARWRGCLDNGNGDGAERFAFVAFGGGECGAPRTTTRWLLVPDVVHGFDCADWRDRILWADEEARMDAEIKTYAYQQEIGEWLWGTVWPGAGG